MDRQILSGTNNIQHELIGVISLVAMRNRNFRLFWFGYLISNAGAWIQSVAQGWLVYELSGGSAVWLGAIGFIRAIPLIALSLVGGTMADRLPKRRILYITQIVMTASSLILGILTYADVAKVWHVIALSSLSAAAQAFEQPTRQSLIPSLVKKEDLHAAISLNAIAFNGAAAFGPSLAGLLVPAFGLAGCFFLNAASFGAVFLALMWMEFPSVVPKVRTQSMMADLVEGLRYMSTRPIILALITMAAVNSFFARPYQQFIPVFAKDVFNSDIGLAGLMQAAPAIGTIIFMLSVASLGNIKWKGKLLITSGIAFSLSLIAFAWAGNVYLSLGLLVLVGGFNMTWQTSTNTLLQENVGDDMRGRVMSSYTMTALAMMPLGQGPMGYSMDTIGPHWALTIGAMISLVFIVYMAVIRVRGISRLA